MIYFDHVATTPMSREALDTYREVAENFYANSESLHQAGNAAGQLVNESKATIANLLDVPVEGWSSPVVGLRVTTLAFKVLPWVLQRRRFWSVRWNIRQSMKS